MNDTERPVTPTDREILLHRGYCLLRQATSRATIGMLLDLCEQAFRANNDDVRARSSRGHVYAARNVIDAIPAVRTVWQSGVLLDFIRDILGEEFGLVRVLFFDKPPDRSWSLPWHKDTAIAVRDNSIASDCFSRPTIKAGVPHVIAPDHLLRRMLTLRIHLDEVTNENGPLKVIPGSQHSSESEGEGVESAATIHAAAGDVLIMRPLLSHASGSSQAGTSRHRRILHLEFAADRELPDGYRWHDFVSGPLTQD